MIIAILVLTVLNLVGVFILFSGQAVIHHEIKQSEERVKHNTDETFAEMGTMIFNMESLKQKVKMTGRAEL